MTAGSVRMGKFVKYLPLFGWDPVVLTVEPKKNIAKGIPLETESFKVVRTPYRDPVGIFSTPPPVGEGDKGGFSKGKSGYHFVKRTLKRISPFTIQRMPDRMLGWYPYAVKAGKKILEWDGIDAVFSSHPSPVNHLVAAELSGRTGVPWVADYRDLWTGSTLRPYPGRLEAVERRYERKVLKRAGALTTVSDTLRDYLADLHGKPVEVIYNGFDPEDFEREAKKEDVKRFTVIYSGTLYTLKQSPVPLFEALKRLREKGIISEENFRVRFIGVQEPPFRDLVNEYGLETLVVSEPFQPYEENVATLKGADALLFFSWNEGEMEGNPTSKIFQYAGAGRPILVVGKGNPFVVEFVKETSTGEIGGQSQEIMRILTRWMEAFTRDGNVGYSPDRKGLERYDRKVQTRQLAGILNKVVM